MNNDIIFPELNIHLHNVGQSISVFGFEIAYYGITIAIAMIIGSTVILTAAKKTNQNEDNYLDIIIYSLIFGVIGARVYYVVFSWDLYKDNILSIFNLRQGGLAIYGGIIFGVIAAFVTSRIKKMQFLQIADTAILGLPLAQAIGRYGNFFNREAFGGYSTGRFRMLLPIDSVRSSSDITLDMMSNVETINNVPYISVHPTFLYESSWNILVFLVLIILYFYNNKNSKFANGTIFMTYLLLYGIGRFFIEQLRTDQLLVPHTSIPVSCALSAVIIAASIVGMLFLKRFSKRG